MILSQVQDAVTGRLRSSSRHTKSSCADASVQAATRTGGPRLRDARQRPAKHGQEPQVWRVSGLACGILTRHQGADLLKTPKLSSSF